jgi:hypothetical protein
MYPKITILKDFFLAVLDSEHNKFIGEGEAVIGFPRKLIEQSDKFD